MIRRINYKLREWRYKLVDALGFPLRLKGREGEVQIICFHGVCEDHHQLINGRFMHLTRYTELLTSLKRYFHVISYNDFLDGKLHPEKLKNTNHSCILEASVTDSLVCQPDGNERFRRKEKGVRTTAYITNNTMLETTQPTGRVISIIVA